MFNRPLPRAVRTKKYMKIGISGKGGSGKTTISATLARVYARQGISVLAIDGDPNPNLGMALGLEAQALEEMCTIPRGVTAKIENADGTMRTVLKDTVENIKHLYGVSAPDGIRLLVGTKVEISGSGCLCSGHAAMRILMGEIVSEANDMTVMDMEASLEHLSRGTIRNVDVLLIVTEPYYRSLETARRTLPLARELGIKNIYAVVNKYRSAEDEKLVSDFCSGHGLEIIARIPFDADVTQADQQGKSLYDFSPDSAVVKEVENLAAELRIKMPVSNYTSAKM